MQDIKQKIAEMVGEFVSTDMLADEANWERRLSELGIDSLDVMTLFLNVQEKFGLSDIPENDIDRLNSLNAIMEYVKAEAGKKTST